VSSIPLSRIQIRQTRTTVLNGPAPDVVESTVSLGEKIDEYIFKLGCSSAHTLGVVVQLLTVGKIRLDFREHHERLQLLNATDALSRPEAMRVTEEYLSMVRQQTPDTAAAVDATQKVIIQAPRRTVL
jgi:hypothetical protein